jgi:hypothetical protein
MMNEKKDKKTTKKAPIAPVLKSLELFKTVTYPIARMSSVRTTAQIIQSEHGMRFVTRKNKVTKELEITRIK